MTVPATSAADLPLPEHYRPENVARFSYRPDQQALFDAAPAWRRRHGIAPASADRRDIHLLLIDVQRDFCFPEGSLYVAGRSGHGAIDDSRRTCELIYKNLARITRVTATLDSHLAFQIFSPAFWVDAAGAPLAAHREISVADVESGRARPNPAMAGWLAAGDVGFLNAYALHYVRELERAGKYRLYLWPPHCLYGSDGHALVGAVHEARLFHAYVRDVQAFTELKGDNPFTENYSVLRPEVLTRHDGRALAHPNDRLTETLLAADALVVAGQAASHCVKSTLEDLASAIRARDPALARKVYLVTDCMSAVTVPDGKGGFAVDFTENAKEALAGFAAAGMQLVESTRPMASWPGFPG